MESVLAIYYLCIDIYIVSTLFYETSTCASYSEVRRFLTSVALKEEESIKEGIYVPDGIVPVCQGGCLIQEGADNIDINTEIIDGKDTFHSMARAVFQARPSPIDSCMRNQSV
jgi:hypothetical protein